MNVRFEQLCPKQLVGIKQNMSVEKDLTTQLWQSFMPRKKELETSNSVLFAVDQYPPNYFESYSPKTTFYKWAAAEVSQNSTLPEQMEKLELGGLHAVFTFRGLPSQGNKLYQYILETWLPNTQYKLDNRPHFWRMGKKYKHNHPESEEELWLPIV